MATRRTYQTGVQDAVSLIEQRIAYLETLNRQVNYREVATGTGIERIPESANANHERSLAIATLRGIACEIERELI